MANMRMDKNRMPEQEPDVRNKNFLEVALGYTKERAVDEAKRCLNCRHKPCVNGCPVRVNIPGFISKVAEGDFEGAYEVLSRDTSLPAVCGRVCPQESQCECKCVRGMKGESVAIGRLENGPGRRADRAARVQRTPGGCDRLRPQRPDLRGRSGEKGV